LPAGSKDPLDSNRATRYGSYTCSLLGETPAFWTCTIISANPGEILNIFSQPTFLSFESDYISRESWWSPYSDSRIRHCALQLRLNHKVLRDNSTTQRKRCSELVRQDSSLDIGKATRSLISNESQLYLSPWLDLLLEMMASPLEVDRNTNLAETEHARFEGLMIGASDGSKARCY
jgi:hypothetical protein